MLYNYLITVYKVIVGLVTPERLMYVGLGAFGFYLIWMCISVIASFQRKFNSRCQELVSFTIKTKDIEKHPELIDLKADKISSGFGFGWKKFRTSSMGKPSDFIKRRDALDVEINGGILNNGKTLMRAYITFFTTLLFIFNFAYIGGEKTITFMSFAESLFVPFIFYVLIKLFYFLHNSIKQKLYRMDIESFYELIDLLDSKFEKKGKFVSEEVEEEQEEVLEKDTEDIAEPEKTEEEDKEENTLDKYDIFKKNNIDVSKILNEVPGERGNSLPHINVDSDFVIKDDDQVGAKMVSQDDNATTLFGGMMQNTSGLKKNNFLEVEKNIAEIDEEKLDKFAKYDLQKEEENNEPIVESSENELENENLEDSVNVKPQIEEVPVVDSIQEMEEESKDDLSSSTSKFIEIEHNDKDDKVNEEQNIASVVSGFKANRSKLASGGMIIERNEPITKRERTGYFSEQDENLTSVTPATSHEMTDIEVSEEPIINRPLTQDSADNVLNTLKSAQGGYDAYVGGQNFAPSTNYGTIDYNQNYGYGGQPIYPNQIPPQMPNYGYAAQPVYPSYAPQNPVYGQGYAQEQPETYDNYEEEEIVEEKPKKQKVVRTKDNEPRPRNLKASTDKKQVKQEVSQVAKRGRPKKQEVSETMVIENDKQFNEVLSRAEKLMRKSDEGLSESQSKRIEKEIKILMDAMNRYKEGK